MELLIDTTEQNKIILVLLNGQGKIIAQKERVVPYISEGLLLELEKFLRVKKVSLRELEKILVNPGPGGFSSTRTGVATANALAYALGIPVAEWPASLSRKRGEPSGKVRQTVLPKYDKEPNITKPLELSS